MRFLLTAVLAIAIVSFLYVGGPGLLRDPPRTEPVSPHMVVRPEQAEVTVSERVPMVYQSNDGKAFRAMVERKRAEHFLQELTASIEARKLEARAETGRQLDTLFGEVFADAEQSVTDYADWFYAWGRSYDILHTALTSALWELASGSLDSLIAGEMRIDPAKVASIAEARIQERLMESYTELVLKPQLRDAKIEAGVEAIVARSYDRFLSDLDGFDLKLVEFLYAADPNAQSIEASRLVSLDLDWQAAQWRGPRDRSGEAVASAAVSATILLGSALFSAEIGALILPVVSAVGAELLTTAGFATAGGVAGSEFPVIGNLVGIVAGLSADYVINRFREGMSREEFEDETRTGLNATIEHWKGEIGPRLNQVSDAWYSDARRWFIPPEMQNLVRN